MEIHCRWNKCANCQTLGKILEAFGQNNELPHFLGVKFTCTKDNDSHVDIFMNQPADTADLISKAGLASPQTNIPLTPYRSGFPVDIIPHVDIPLPNQEKLNKQLQEYVGSLNWLSNRTRPDTATITNIIAPYNSKSPLVILELQNT